jgi:hypothetical protein
MQGPVDLRGERFVVLAARAPGDELLVPGVDLGEVGKSPFGEGPQQVECRGGLVVGGQHAGRVRDACRLGGGVVVDHVAAEARKGAPVDDLGGRGAGLGELPGDTAQLDHREAGAVGQDHGHLQDDLELVSDAVGREIVKGLGAVARLQQEGSP